MILHDNPDILIERPESRSGAFSLLREMRVEKGCADDWEQLHELHYKAEGKPIGPHYWRCVLGEDQLVGVVIFSVPKLLLAGRHQLFPKLKPGQDTTVTNKYRAAYINKNFVVNSRTVVDTLFRASGVSYRMLNLAARLEGTRYVEIQSSMSRFNPFAMRAGFKFAKPQEPKLYEKGLAFMQRYFTSHPADHEGIVNELEAMKPAVRSRTLAAMREFYYRHSAMEKTGSNLNAGTSRVEAMPPATLVRHMQQLLFASPMYGVYVNPDAGRQLPASLPLLAFDNQKPSEPLRLDLV